MITKRSFTIKQCLIRTIVLINASSFPDQTLLDQDDHPDQCKLCPDQTMFDQDDRPAQHVVSGCKSKQHVAFCHIRFPAVCGSSK